MQGVVPARRDEGAGRNGIHLVAQPILSNYVRGNRAAGGGLQPKRRPANRRAIIMPIII
jgi:hypothetical protein